jgi:HK97 family phage major capsid protein
MTINELKIERQSKVDAMASIVENRGESMNEESLAAIKTFKSEIANIDLKIEAIEELRSVAIQDGRPAEKKAIDAKEEVRSEFGKYIRGAITSKEYEQRAVSVGANGDVVPDTFLADLHEKIKEFSTFSMNAQELVTNDKGEV